jgi:peptidoglycan/xylan/chitin deacetylase (PgdA/CDA1 family)
MMKKIAALLLAAALAIGLLPARTSAAEPKGCLALTFDDGPSGELTDALLEGLRARRVKATFFVCGYRVEQFPDALRHIAADGHELGLHSENHDYMQHMTALQAQDDLVECRAAVEECCGVSPVLFRPPGGLYSDALLRAAREEKLSVVLWSVDPRDWDPACRAKALGAILRGAGDGKIILMHDLSKSSVQTALRAVDCLRAEGYRFCTVSELAAVEGEKLEPGQVYRSFAR